MKAQYKAKDEEEGSNLRSMSDSELFLTAQVSTLSVCASVCVCACINAYVCVCACVYAYICMCVCV